MVKHFGIEVLSIPILKIYKYCSLFLVCHYDESVSYLSSSYLSCSVAMNKDNFQKYFFFIFNFLHESFICSHNTDNENHQKETKNLQSQLVSLQIIKFNVPAIECNEDRYQHIDL